MIVNLFDPGFTVFKAKDRVTMTFHTKKQVIELFKDFKILSFKEIKEPATEPGKFDHTYELCVQK